MALLRGLPGVEQLLGRRLLEASAIEPTTSAYLLADPLMVHHLKTITLD